MKSASQYDNNDDASRMVRVIIYLTVPCVVALLIGYTIMSAGG